MVVYYIASFIDICCMTMVGLEKHSLIISAKFPKRESKFALTLPEIYILNRLKFYEWMTNKEYRF